MESDSDLPLIEITGEEDEDDSLLFYPKLPDPDVENRAFSFNHNADYFACSPLQLSMIKPHLAPSSQGNPVLMPNNTEGLKDNVDPAKPACSSSKSSSNKENININKSEVPRLSVEPVQMKKRKKGGGYNLRKSLAWDKAFDTDEGVLDPLELSMISGAFGRSYREVLPIISEEEKHSLNADSNCTNEYEDLQANANNSFTELSYLRNTLKEDGKEGVSLVPKHDSLAHSNATRKVVSAIGGPGGAKTRSKGAGCPRPLAPSSLKRPASANTVRVTRKESKLQKIPVSKPGSSLLPTTTRSTILNTSHLTNNQIAKPALNGQKNIGLKSSSKNLKVAQNRAKTGATVLPSQAKDPAQHSARNLKNSLLEVKSTHARQLEITRAKSDAEMFPDQVPPSTGLHLCEGEKASAAHAISVPQNTCVVDGKMKIPKIVPVKPSGLRLPSPSIGFFGQSKASTSDTLPQKNVGPCARSLGGNVHGTQKFGMSRPPPIPGKTPAKCAVPDKMMKVDVGVLNAQKAEVMIQSDCKNSEPLYEKRKAHDNTEVDTILQQPVDCIKVKKDSKLQIIDEKVLLEGGSGDFKGDNGAMMLSAVSKECGRNEIVYPKLMSHQSITKPAMVVPGTEGMPEQEGKDKMQNTSTLNDDVSKSQCGDSVKQESHKFSLVLDSSTSYTQDPEQLSGEQAEVRNSCSHRRGPGCHLDSHCFETHDRVCKLFGESQKHEVNNVGYSDSCRRETTNMVTELFEGSQKYEKGSSGIADVKTPQPQLTGNELDNSNVPFPYEDRKPEDDGLTRADGFFNKSSVGHAQQCSAYANLSSETFTCESSAAIELLEGCELIDQSANCFETSSHQEQANEGATGVDISNKSLVGPAQQEALNKNLFAENCYCNPSTSMDHTERLKVCILSDQSANCLEKKSVCIALELSSQFNTQWHSGECLLPAKSSCSEEPHSKVATDTVQCILPEISEVSVRSWNVSSSNNTQVPGQLKDGGADVGLVSEQSSVEEGIVCSLEVTPLTENNEDASCTDIRPYVSSIGEATPFDVGALLSTESGLLAQIAQPSSKGGNEPCKVEDGLNQNLVVREAECQMRGCNDLMEISHGQIQIAYEAHQDVRGVGNMLESPLEDEQLQLIDGDKLDGSSSRLSSISHDQALRIDSPNEVFGEADFPEINLKSQHVFEGNQLPWKDNLYRDSEEFQEEYILESVIDVQDDEEVCGCVPEISSIVSQAPPTEPEKCVDFTEDLPSVEDAPSGSPGIHSAEYNDILSDTQFTDKMELSGQATSSVDTRLEVRKGRSTSLGSNDTKLFLDNEESLLKRSTSFKKLDREQLEVPNSRLEFEECLTENQGMKDHLFAKEITDTEECQEDNVLESLADVPEQTVICKCDPESSNLILQIPLAAEGSSLELSEDRKACVADAPLFSVESTSENPAYLVDGLFSHDLKICGQAVSEVNSKLSEDQIAGVSTSCIELFTVQEEPCALDGEDTDFSKCSSQKAIGLGSLKKSCQDLRETEIPQKENCLMSELGHELHTSGDLEKDKYATLPANSLEKSMKLDLSLILHPPNAVPFSDEWLAAIEAAGEDILTMKRGAVQNSPPSKSLHEPGPYSPVKRKNNQLGPFDCTKYGNTQSANPL